MSANLLTAESISVVRAGRQVVQDVSLSIKERDFITIIGPNGAGKSILLKCLLGLFKPDSGSLYKRPGLAVGYMPQSVPVEPTIPIAVERFLLLRQKVSAERVREVAELSQVADLLARPLSALSGGELQRVLLARALLGKPDLLVLDEPAQNLDVSGQLAFYKLLDDLYAQHELSILMVSHDLHMVMASTRQVICLYHHVCCSGAPQAVTQAPEFISLFGQDMAKMMAVYNHNHNHSHARADI